MQNEQCLWFVEDRFSDRWRIEVTNGPAFIDAVGADLLTHFACCFVHADRLTSLVGLAYLSERHFGQSSSAFKRDLQTSVWFVAGTLREFTRASAQLRGALAQRQLQVRDAEPWERLKEIESRWDRDRRYINLRNKIAFHVDSKGVGDGIEALRSDDRINMIEGDGPRAQNVSAPFGIVAAIRGAIGGEIAVGDEFAAAFREFIRAIRQDLATPTDLIHSLFLDVMSQLGFTTLRKREAFRDER